MDNKPWMSVDEWQEDEKAVLAWREFVESEHGQKLARVLAGLNPLARLATLDSVRPDLVRAVAKAESESAEALLGKATGYQLVCNALFQVMTKAKTAAPRAHSRRAGGRDIPPHTHS